MLKNLTLDYKNDMGEKCYLTLLIKDNFCEIGETNYTKGISSYGKISIQDLYELLSSKTHIVAIGK